MFLKVATYAQLGYINFIDFNLFTYTDGHAHPSAKQKMFALLFFLLLYPSN